MTLDHTDSHVTVPQPHAHVQSHRASDDLQHLWKEEPWRRFVLAAFLMWSMCPGCCDTQKDYQFEEGPLWFYPFTCCRGRRNHSICGWNMALIMFYLDTGAQLVTGQQGLSCPQESRHRNPHPARCQQQKKNELMKLKSFKFLMKNPN